MDLILRYATTDPFIRESYLIRALLCIPQDQVEDMFSATVADKSRESFMNQSKVSALKVLNSSIKGINSLVQAAKNKMFEEVTRGD